MDSGKQAALAKGLLPIARAPPPSQISNTYRQGETSSFIPAACTSLPNALAGQASPAAFPTCAVYLHSPRPIPRAPVRRQHGRCPNFHSYVDRQHVRAHVCDSDKTYWYSYLATPTNEQVRYMCSLLRRLMKPDYGFHHEPISRPV